MSSLSLNPPAGYLAIYTNGVLMGENPNITISMAGVWAALNKIGADNWPDPGLQGSVDEFHHLQRRLVAGRCGKSEHRLSDPNQLPHIWFDRGCLDLERRPRDYLAQVLRDRRDSRSIRAATLESQRRVGSCERGAHGGRSE